jgi:hypothetical protein
MKINLTFVSRLLLSFGIVSLALTGCKDNAIEDVSVQKTEEVQATQEIPNKYIVVYKDNFGQEIRRNNEQPGQSREMRAERYKQSQQLAREEIGAMLRSVKVSENAMERVYSNAVIGFAAELTKAEVEVLRKDPRVAYVEEDQEVKLQYAPASVASVTEIQAQETPWGITRVGGAVNSSTLARWAWVIDSGIQLDHPDLNVNKSYSKTFVSGTSSATDENGHGTHVAGTIAAKNNTTGVIGVAAGATVVPVRVFGASGGSSNSVIISGIDYVTSVAYAYDVANMSFGGGASSAIDDAVKKLAASGVYCAIAAGNSSANANNYSPARVNATRVWTISAMDRYDYFASFSNYANPPIDYCAPGVSIKSCWIGSGYNTISGTSMATPHVAGILLVNNGVVKYNAYVKNDPDGNPDKTAVR